MSLRRRCASSRCPPFPTRARARRRHRFRASRGRGGGSCARRSARLARSSRARSTGDRCRTRDRATRAARSRTPPIRSGIARLFSSPTGQFPRGVYQPAAPRTLADPASSPRSIRRLSPRARRSAPSSVISRYVSASRREPPEPPSTSTRYVFATWCPVSLPRRTGRWPLGELSSRRAAGRARDADPTRGGSGRGIARPRVRADPAWRADHAGEPPRPPPRVHVSTMDAVGRSIQTGYRTDPASGPPRAVRSGVTWR